MEKKSILKFSDLKLTPAILRSIDKMGFENPTPIQESALEPMLEKRDVLALAPTGTGKTCAFGIPMIEGICMKTERVQAVVLCPTRELAIQTTTVLKKLTAFKQGVRIATLYGGEPIGRQISALRRRPQVIVATPGRMMDHLNRRTVRLEQVDLLVLDEADRMLDMGFREDIDTILEKIPEKRQTVLFSATMSKGIKQIAEKYQNDAFLIQIGQEIKPVDTVVQFYTEVGTQKKPMALIKLLQEKQFGRTLVFVGTKIMAETLAGHLVQEGLNTLALHGNLNQRQRDVVMAKYRSGHASILVATDVASRGIDVSNIDAVINYDIPQDSESYVHRIGRTGRASQTGAAYTFIYSKERDKLRSIMSVTGSRMMPFVIQGVSEKGVQLTASTGRGAGSGNKASGNRNSGSGRNSSPGRSAGRSNNSGSKHTGNGNSPGSNRNANSNRNSSEFAGKRKSRKNTGSSFGGKAIASV